MLFIDEAYTSPGAENDFGREAIDRCRSSWRTGGTGSCWWWPLPGGDGGVPVRNPGLRSRFDRDRLPDYSTDELLEIVMCRKQQYELDDGRGADPCAL